MFAQECPSTASCVASVVVHPVIFGQGTCGVEKEVCKGLDCVLVSAQPTCLLDIVNSARGEAGMEDMGYARNIKSNTESRGRHQALDDSASKLLEEILNHGLAQASMDVRKAENLADTFGLVPGIDEDEDSITSCQSIGDHWLQHFQKLSSRKGDDSVRDVGSGGGNTIHNREHKARRLHKLCLHRGRKGRGEGNCRDGERTQPRNVAHNRAKICLGHQEMGFVDNDAGDLGCLVHFTNMVSEFVVGGGVNRNEENLRGVGDRELCRVVYLA